MEIPAGLSLALIENDSKRTFGFVEHVARGVFDKTSMRLWRTTKHENRVQRASYVETGQSVIQASVVGDCLKVGSLCDNTDPADKTDPRQ